MIQLGPDSGKRNPRLRASAVPAFICSDVALLTYVTPVPVSSKRTPRMHFMLNVHNNSHIGILDVLTTKTMLATTEHPGPLPLRSQNRQIRAESAVRLWEQDAVTFNCYCAALEEQCIRTNPPRLYLFWQTGPANVSRLV